MSLLPAGMAPERSLCRRRNRWSASRLLAAVCVVVAASLLEPSAALEDDPFAGFARDFVSQGTKLRAERDANREAFKLAEASFKEAKSTVRELERQLEVARQALLRNETAFNEAKAAKQAAEKAVLTSLTRIASDLTRTAEEAMGIERSAPAPGSEGAEGAAAFDVQPEDGAQVTLWDGRFFSGRRLDVPCCVVVDDLWERLQKANIRSVRSITMPAGVRGTFQTTVPYLEKEASSFELFGSLGEVDSTVMDFTESCCKAVHLRSGIRHVDDTSVVLYEEEGFEGKAAPYREGDFGAPPLKKVGSIRVPVGLRVTLRATELGGSSESFGSIIGVFSTDSRTFPHADTSTAAQTRARQPPIRSISVRRIAEKDLHGLFVYPEPGSRGRPQFFASGSHYLYPETWPAIRSIAVTNQTFARLFASIMKIVRASEDELDGNFSRPHTIEVSAMCDPPDYCGPHGKCVQPQRCSCSGAFQGERCHLQVPDETSAIICAGNAVVVGEALNCRLNLRRDGLPCNATSLFLEVRLTNDAEVVGQLLPGTPVVRQGGIPRHNAQEAGHFDFQVVFNQTANFTSPFEFTVFGKAAKGMFVPRLEVTRRCDADGASARVTCASRSEGSHDAASAGGIGCRLNLVDAAGHALRCPFGSVRSFVKADWREVPLAPCSGLATGAGNPTMGDGAAGPTVAVAIAATDSWCFVLLPESEVLLRVEVRHHGAALAADAPPSAVLEAVAASAAARARVTEAGGAEAMGEARSSLVAGDVAGALQRLEACPTGYQPCARLRRSLLRQLGAGGGHGASAQKAGAGVCDRHGGLAHAAAAARAAPLAPGRRLDYAEEALLCGEFDLALEQLRLGRRSRRLGGAGGDAADDSRALRAAALGQLGVGLAKAALHNLRGCAEVQELSGLPPECADFSQLVAALADEVASLRAASHKAAWDKVETIAARMATTHSAWWPAFGLSLFGVELDATLCAARDAAKAAAGEANATLTEAEAEPCRRVAEASDSMRERLHAEVVLRCHVVLARALESSGRIPEALQQLAVAEEFARGPGGEDEEEEEETVGSSAAEARILRERLLRNLRKQGGQEQASNGTNGSNGSRSEDMHKKPANHYEALGLSKNATLAEIKAAYRHLALKYHPDKNSDPEAVPIFLDVQQAYQVLSDEALRRRYDAGQDVDDEAGSKNTKPMQYRVVEIDRKRGVARVWWFDPNTGEEGFMEVEVPAEDLEAEDARGGRTLHDHCCLPQP